MGDLFWLSDDQLRRLEPFFPKSKGAPHGRQPARPKGDAGGGRGRLLGRSIGQGPIPRRDVSEADRGGLTSKLHVVADAKGRPIAMFPSAGHRSDHVGAAALLPALPPGAKVLVADRGYDADWLRWGLADRGIAACIPARRCRKAAAPHDPALCRQRRRIESTFARLEDRRRIATVESAALDRPLSRPLPLGLRLGHRGAVLVVSPEPRAHATGPVPRHSFRR